MAKYTSIDDIQSRLPTQIAELSPTTEPSDTQVLAWIDEVEAEVEGILSTRYQLPITGTQSLAIVKSICADLVAARVWRMKAAGINDPTQLQYAEQLEKSARERLQQLADGTMTLPDQPEAITSTTPAGDFPEAIFERDKVQW